MEWGRGLAQRDEAKERAAALAAARDGPFARRREDLDDEQMTRGRWGDPMLAMVQRKERKKSKKQSKGGASATSAAPRYNGPLPANRFDIRPGAHWDGIDRSNKFEIQYFAMKSAKKAGSTDRYHWSVENM
jgi:pre-mRNA-splicing factor CWC26